MEVATPFDYAKLKDEVSRQTILNREAVSELIDVYQSYGLHPTVDGVNNIIGKAIIAGYSPIIYVSKVFDVAAKIVAQDAADRIFESILSSCV